MSQSLKFDFCNLTVFDNYIIVNIKEGINVTPDRNNTLIDITETYFLNKPFVYISNRINSYSVDPKVYLKTSKIKNLEGLAIVSSNYQAKVNAEIEKMFFKKPFEIFSELEEAIVWAHKITKTE
ncbi:hypothetical protein [Winogradskyella wichelsiae]|uniref:hypothetical protein n=1 Tax=Winogradskyella wichelsiae TaxID=2697007 RepID=UPI0015C7587F|nr:hypothetical protein [Winogradskyella wichelsiae]